MCCLPRACTNSLLPRVVQHVALHNMQAQEKTGEEGGKHCTMKKTCHYECREQRQGRAFLSPPPPQQQQETVVTLKQQHATV